MPPRYGYCAPSGMRVAVPLFGSRVSPRCLIAKEIVFLSVEDGRVLGRERADLEIGNEEDLVERLLDLGADVLVCGGIRRELARDLAANGVRVIDNVAGELSGVVEALEAGNLAPGHGLTACPRLRRDPGEAALRGIEKRIYEVGRDISAETDPKLCRIAELVHFVKGMGYRRVGLAFCRELSREVETLTAVLSRFFTVVPVGCRVGAEPGENGCRPALQAATLNRAGTELNVIAGLCLGSDVIFTARSRAPVTTLFVKDRSLAHNPVGAIYTRYHLEELTEEVS